MASTRKIIDLTRQKNTTADRSAFDSEGIAQANINYEADGQNTGRAHLQNQGERVETRASSANMRMVNPRRSEAHQPSSSKDALISLGAGGNQSET